MAPRKLATIQEVADYLGVTDKTLRRWAARGEGPTPSRVAGQYRYRWDDVEAFVEAQQITRPAGPRRGCLSCGRSGGELTENGCPSCGSDAEIGILPPVTCGTGV